MLRVRHVVRDWLPVLPRTPLLLILFFTLVTGPRRSLSLKLSDTNVYEPQIRARLGTTATPLLPPCTVLFSRSLPPLEFSRASLRAKPQRGLEGRRQKWPLTNACQLLALVLLQVVSSQFFAEIMGNRLLFLVPEPSIFILWLYLWLTSLHVHRRVTYSVYVYCMLYMYIVCMIYCIGAGFGSPCLPSAVQGSGFRVQGVGCRVVGGCLCLRLSLSLGAGLGSRCLSSAGRHTAHPPRTPLGP